MKGLKLSSLTGELNKVDEKFQEKPATTIKSPGRKISAFWKNYLRERGFSAPFMDYYPHLPLEAFSNFTIDELCKMRYSSIFMMHDTVRRLFETKARYEVVWKIVNSMWRWGYGRDVWNEVVDAYKLIRNFVFSADPNFETRLDHATYHNEFGYAKYSRIFIDGSFAFLVYYKKKHVMTIGFSIMEGRRILIQQVQGAERSGNRYLYRLPANRLEFVIELFQKNFPGYKLHVIDAGSLTKKTLSDYRNALEFGEKQRTRYEEEIKTCTGDELEYSRRWLKESKDRCKALEEMIFHLKADTPRLVSFYQNGGRFKIGPEAIKVNNLAHYCVE